MQKPTEKRLVLASNSPRRRELLALIDNDFRLSDSRDVDESYPADMLPHDVSPYISQKKAEAYRQCLVPDEIIITADTTVINGDKILGKPQTHQEAVEMLMSLMNHAHEVVTGVTLTSQDRQETFAETTTVTFGDLSREEIENYVCQYNPLDKAGAYGIQEWIGCVGITGIEGCFYNVMGLPLNALYRHLKKFDDSKPN